MTQNPEPINPTFAKVLQDFISASALIDLKERENDFREAQHKEEINAAIEGGERE